jgi:hypothetical protein
VRISDADRKAGEPVSITRPPGHPATPVSDLSVNTMAAGRPAEVVGIEAASIGEPQPD